MPSIISSSKINFTKQISISSWKIFCAIFILLLLDVSLGFFAKEKMNSFVEVEKFQELKNKNNSSDVVILGSSHAKENFHPKVFEDKLSMSCFNHGFGGANIINTATLYKTHTKHLPHPSYLVIAVDTYSLANLGKNNLGVYVYLVPFMNFKEKFSFFLSRDYPILDLLKLLSGAYLFRVFDPEEKVDSIFSKNFSWEKTRHFFNTSPSKKSKEEPSYYRGFASNEKTSRNAKDLNRLDRKFERFFSVKVKALDQKKKLYLENLISSAKENGSKVILVLTPEHNEMVKREKFRDFFIAAFGDIAKAHDITFLNYSTHPSFIYNADLFYDYHHLSIEGAKLFTSLFADAFKAALN